MSFSSIYANYAGIFNHKSMEKDKLFVLDVCGAYGLKDIEKLDRSEINEPARDNGCRVFDFMLVYANYTDIFYHRSMDKDKNFVLDVWRAYGQKDIKRLDSSGPACLSGVGWALNEKNIWNASVWPLNWHHGGCTCIDFICLDRCFIPVATKEPFTKTLKCLARPLTCYLQSNIFARLLFLKCLNICKIKWSILVYLFYHYTYILCRELA